MRILILNWRDIKHPLAGGAEISLFEHAKYWSQRGAQIVLFTSSFKGARKEEEIGNIKIIRRGTHHTVHIWALFYFLKGRFGDLDIVIDCFHFAPFFTPFYVRGKRIIALINEPAKQVWFRNISFPLNVIGFVLEPFFFLPYRKVTFITGSESIAKELQAEYGIRAAFIHIIHHGVTVKKLSWKIAKEKFPTIIYLSRISSDKGIEDAFYAVSHIAKKVSSLQFWVVGKEQNVSYLDKARRLVRELEIEKIVRFFGFVSEVQKFDLLSRAWILIHPSIREGWGINVIEANSVGTPAVGYRVSGLQDSIRHGRTGLLTRKNTAWELAEAVCKLIKDEKLYRALSHNAVEWSQTFSWDDAGKKSWEVLISS